MSWLKQLVEPHGVTQLPGTLVMTVILALLCIAAALDWLRSSEDMS